MTAKLEPGQHTIDTTNPTKRSKEDGGGVIGKFSLRLWSGKRVRVTVVAPTAGEWRTRAREKAEERLRAEGRVGAWKPDSLITEYMNEVSRPAIKAANLRERSVEKYVYLLDILEDEFAGLAIRDAVRFRRLEAILQKVARERGAESARQARNVISKWVIQQLIRDELVEANPLAGMAIQLGNVKKSSKTKGVALTEAEYEKTVDYLLNVDVEDVKAPKQGRYTKADRAAVRRNTVELTLLQAATGLRIGEALSLTYDEINDDGQQITVTVTPERSKTHRGRTVPVLDDRIAARLRERVERSGGRGLVFPAPANPEGRWDHANAQKAVRRLFDEVADACEIDTLRGVSSHMWRATLNTRAMNAGVPVEVRAAYFGHTAIVNRNNYTDTADTTALTAALHRGLDT
ncbi:MAG: site-specific integrase [Actinomycetaceae bacterium]|nr:site-specific integrase [Actinomycetaceae bacterium]